MTFHLLSHKYKKISGILYAISLAALAGLLIIENFADDLGEEIISFFNAHGNTVFKPNIFFDLFFDEAFMFIAICSGLIYAFSMEKDENETIVRIRYKSLIWSFIINYILLLLLYLTTYGIQVYFITSVFILSQLLIFILHFKISIYRLSSKNTSL